MVSLCRYAVSSMGLLSYRTSAFASSRSCMSFVRGGAAATRLESSTTTVTETSTSQCFLEVSPSYQELVEKLKTITHLGRASAVLGYDQLVFMPQADQTSVERGAQMAALASIIHEQSTSPRLLELIDQSIGDLQATPNKENFEEEARILELERKAFVETERVPAKLAKKSAELSSSAYAAWVKARKASDFAAFCPVLQDCFDTAMSIADAKRGDDKTKSLYTQMLDEFEMGMPQQRMDDIFQQVQQALVPLIAKVLDSETPPSTKPLEGAFPLEKQKGLSQEIVTSIGFDQEIGRIDVSVHPFTTSFSPSDVRITSRFSEQEWYQGLAGTIHEGGHAIYEQNLKSSALSIDSALSMGTHESQSLFWERHIGLSKPFWKWATPMLNKHFGDYDHTDEQVYGAVNAVSKSLIRVEADELTYPLHIILRYNIEKDVIEGKMQVEDIPNRWNKNMKEMLGVDVPSDDKGCLQDVHWSSLAFGYFPTYLIGAMTAAQLEHYCRKDIFDFDAKIEKGEFSEIKLWLTNKVHSHGRRYKSLDALLEDQLGEQLNPKYFIEYLTQKYSELYQID